MAASHNDLQDRCHFSDFPDQRAISAFLRRLLRGGRTQVQLAHDAQVPYNTLTNWFTDDPPSMKADALLRLVIAAGQVDEFARWLRDYRAERPVDVSELKPIVKAEPPSRHQKKRRAR